MGPLTKFCMAIAAWALFFSAGLHGSAYCQNNLRGQEKTEHEDYIGYTFERAELAESLMNSVTQALDALNRLNKADGAFLKKYNLTAIDKQYRAFFYKNKLPEGIEKAELILTYLNAAYHDISVAVQTHNYGGLINGQVMKELPKTLIDKAVNIMVSIVEEGFDLKGKVPTFGLEQFAKAQYLFSTSGDYIDGITCLLDGINEYSWACTGLLIGGPKTAVLFQQAGGAAAEIMRSATYGFFRDAVNASSGVKETMLNNYYTLQLKRVKLGLLAEPIFKDPVTRKGMYSYEELKEARFTDKEIDQFEEYADNINAHIAKTRKDWSFGKFLQIIKHPDAPRPPDPDRNTTRKPPPPHYPSPPEPPGPPAGGANGGGAANGGGPAPSAPTKGVQMKMKIDKSSTRRVDSLKKVRDQILKDN